MGTTRTGRPSRVTGLLDSKRVAAYDTVAAPARLMLGNIELAALDTELAYRGPERRNGPAASLAQLLACVLDEVDYGLLMLSADGAVVHANHAARSELASTTSLRLAGRRLVSRTASEQRQLDDALAAARDGGRRTMLTIATGGGVPNMPVYLATVAAEEPGTIQYACGVLAMAVNSGLGGSACCAARIAAEVGLT